MLTVGVPLMLTLGVLPMFTVPATVTEELTALIAPMVLLPGPMVTVPLETTTAWPTAIETTGLLATPGVGEMSTPALSQMMIAAPLGGPACCTNPAGRVQLARPTSV